MRVEPSGPKRRESAALKETRKRYRRAHPKLYRDAVRRYRKKHPEVRKAIGRRYYHRHKERLSAAASLEWFARRLRILMLYGGKCACCGLENFEFLAIDHIHGGGIKHRRTFTSRQRYWRWLAEKRREGFRVLCHNCNHSRGMYGYCPHEREQK